MRGIAYALLASGVLALGAMVPTPAAAGCYGDDCDDGYRTPRTTYYESAPRTYERYAERPYYRDDVPVYRTRTSYDRPRYYDRPNDYRRPTKVYRSSCYERPNCYDRPAVKTTYYSSDSSYSDRPSYRSYSRPYYRKHYHSHRYDYPRRSYPTVRYGGGWSQTGYDYRPGYAYYRGCHTAYIPYGWNWYRARSC